MITPSKFYGGVEKTLEASYPFMVVLAIVVIGVTLWLLYKRNPVALAAWLVYLYMP